ncbi:hypothetical protein PghCCS26_12510 [Paenibacillus glycanilyticus]|uniref:Uncharacterized protein n=1 Tax=Paenibacillus glycanilyticus TaxID=126569 RepID=A0ABQ6NHB1_9BACL|nr:hypothetical protein PghCCS26_12510 [Paenibacillus glycanilyticus]
MADAAAVPSPTTADVAVVPNPTMEDVAAASPMAAGIRPASPAESLQGQMSD